MKILLLLGRVLQTDDTSYVNEGEDKVKVLTDPNIHLDIYQGRSPFYRHFVYNFRTGPNGPDYCRLNLKV